MAVSSVIVLTVYSQVGIATKAILVGIFYQ